MNTKFLTTKEIMEVFQVTENTVYRWRVQGMPVERIGPKTLRYDLDKVRAWAANREK